MEIVKKIEAFLKTEKKQGNMKMEVK